MPQSFIDKLRATENASPVAAVINRTKNNTKFQAFWRRMIADEAFLNNQDTEATPMTKEQWLDPDFGKSEYQSWQPALLYKAMLTRLTDLAPYISSPDVNNPLIRGANEDLEYFLNGSLNMINEQFEDRGQVEPYLSNQLPGKYERVHCRTCDDGQLQAV